MYIEHPIESIIVEEDLKKNVSLIALLLSKANEGGRGNLSFVYEL